MDMPAVNMLRLMRIFKMVRLFRKLLALRILISALISSIVPVLYSFAILLLVTSLYAIAATQLFHISGMFPRILLLILLVRCFTSHFYY